MIAEQRIDTRLLKLTDDLIARGVSADNAATHAARALIDGERITEKPWLSTQEASLLIDLHPETIEKFLRAGDVAFKGAKKFGGQWRIPRCVIFPQTKS